MPLACLKAASAQSSWISRFQVFFLHLLREEAFTSLARWIRHHSKEGKRACANFSSTSNAFTGIVKPNGRPSIFSAHSESCLLAYLRSPLVADSVRHSLYLFEIFFERRRDFWKKARDYTKKVIPRPFIRWRFSTHCLHAIHVDVSEVARIAVS